MTATETPTIQTESSHCPYPRLHLGGGGCSLRPDLLSSPPSRSSYGCSR
jgi:hypothetical protein